MAPRPLVPLVLAASILLAGCSLPGSDTTPTSGPGGATLSLGAPVAMGAGGPEPVIQIAPDEATMYVAAQDATGGAPHVFVSTDGGASWRAASNPSSASGGEVDIAVGAGGVAYVTQLGTQGNVVSVSRDRGASWTPSLLGTTQYFDREWVAVDASGSAHLVARDFQKSSAVASRSDDGGVTFLARGAPWDAQHEPGVTDGNLVAAGTTLVLPYVCRDGNGACVATSADRGVTWTQRLVALRNVGIDNVYPIAAGSGSTLVLVWSDASANDGRIAVYGALSRDAGASWSAPARLSRSDETATLAWVAARGNAWFVAYATTPGAFESADAAGAATAPWRIAVAKLDVGGNAPTVAARSGDAFGRPMHVGLISKPVGNPGGGPSDRRFGDFFTIAVDAKGRVVLAALDTASGTRTTDWVVTST